MFPNYIQSPFLDNKVNICYKQGLENMAFICKCSKQHVTANSALTKSSVFKLQVCWSTKLKVCIMSWAAVWKKDSVYKT